MERGLYIAAAGMIAGLARQDLIANDLANAATPGYKSDRAGQTTFGSMVLANTRTGTAIGTLDTGVEVDRVVTDLGQGAIRETGERLDFAIEGDGFFAVQTPNGVRYTRNGSFAVGAGGTLTDAFGNQVLGPDRRPVTVKAGAVDPARLGVFGLTGVRKEGDSLYTGRAGAATGQVRAGALEDSSTDPARAMVDMMASMRAYEAGQKAISTIDETLGKATTQVGSLS